MKRNAFMAPVVAVALAGCGGTRPQSETAPGHTAAGPTMYYRGSQAALDHALKAMRERVNHPALSVRRVPVILGRRRGRHERVPNAAIKGLIDRGCGEVLVVFGRAYCATNKRELAEAERGL